MKNILANIPYLCVFVPPPPLPPPSEKKIWFRLCWRYIWGNIFSDLVLIIFRYAIPLSLVLKSKCMEFIRLIYPFWYFFLIYSTISFSFLCPSAAPMKNKSVTHKDTFSLIHYITALHAHPLQGSMTLDLCHQEHPILWPALRPKGTLQTSYSLFPPGTKLWICYCPLKMCGSALKCWPVQHF